MPERSRALLASPLPGDEVVISGIAGYFPKSNSVMELQKNLFNKVDMLSCVNQSYAHSIKPKRMGKINNPTKFDQVFFDNDYVQAHCQNPMIRILLERTYEAIIDAGINPVELENTKTGVFVACTCSESEEKLLYDKVQENMNGLIGSSEAMLALQILKWLKVNGPAYKLDSACSSSMHALEQAFKFLREDHLDYAIVAGVQLNMLNYTGDFDELCVLSEDGRCKSFDNSADGFIRSEAIVACFLQKAKTSRRIYAQIVHSKTTSDGFKEEGLIHPSMKEQERLLKEFYEECSVPIQNIEYMECHATGTPVGDFQELGAVDAVMCSGRTKPLWIGSIRSNMGHGETAAALCSIAKLCIAYNTGYIAPNINYWKCRQDVPALIEGRLKVVTDKLQWNRGLAALNSFGFGGSNAHTLLNNMAKKKECDGVPQDDLPRLVCVSGRTHTAVTRIFDCLEAKKLDVEEVRLWQAIHEHNIEKHGFRGYTLLKSSSDVGESLGKDIYRIPDIQHKICFLYSDKTLQIGIIPQLMEIPIFAATITKCHETLIPKGINLMNIMNNADSDTTVLNSFVINTAAQIALTDVLKAVEIQPDYIIGYGAGEIACAYADSCLTLEQAMIIAYYRGMASTEALATNGESASMCLGYNKPKRMRPDTEKKVNGTSVEINNCKNGGTVKDIITKTASSNIFDIGFKKAISSLNPHSKRWVRTSTYVDQWESQESDISTIEYFTKNFPVPISFAKTCQIIPTDCIHIDMIPHNEHKTFIQENQRDSIYVGLLPKNEEDCLQYFLKAFGKLYLAGLNPRIANLYPHVPFPVSQGTPMLSHLVEWDHREEWFTDLLVLNKQMCNSFERAVVISLEKDEYLNGNIIDGRNLYPASGYLVLVWETLAQIMQKSYQDISVIFENVSFKKNIEIPKTGPIEFLITIDSYTGEFEVTENNSSIVTGRVCAQSDVSQNVCELISDVETDNMKQHLESSDVYNFLFLRGHNISGDFQRIIKCNMDRTYYSISWINNWVIFLDNMLQTLFVKEETNNIMLPTNIERISIDVSIHYASLRALGDPKIIKVYGDEYLNDVRSAGIEITSVDFTFLSKTPKLDPSVIETYNFFPFEQKNPTKLDDAIRANIQVILENVRTYTFKAVEVIDREYKRKFQEPLLNNIFNIFQDQPLINAELTLFTNELIEMPCNTSIEVKNNISKYNNATLVIGANLCENLIALNQYFNILGDQGFVMSREPLDFQKTKYLNNNNIIAYTNTETEYLVLLKKQKTTEVVKFIEMKTDEEYTWIDEIKNQLNLGGIFVVYAQDEYSGLVGFINCLKREPDGENVRGFLIKDKSAPPFDPALDFYKKQLKKNLTINVYENGHWGTYSHVLLKDLDLPMPVHNAYLNIERVGNLASLKWTEGTVDINCKRNTDLLLIQVYCAPINFRDVMLATGKLITNDISTKELNQQKHLGVEFVGRTANGSRVMGMSNKALSNIVLANRDLLLPIPDEWSFEEAATVFVAYFTAYAALVVNGNLKYGGSVLIHGGLDDVGQAAINVALSYGCEIFTTVDSASKRALISKVFPGIKNNHISYSGDMSFEDMIQRETKGKGVDVVLNSLTGDALLATARCLGNRGRFLEIGKFDLHKDAPIQMYFYQREISFHGIHLEYIQQDKYAGLRQRILDLIANGITSGAVHPLTYSIFDTDEVKSAYKYITAEKNVGKVVIKFRDEEPRGKQKTNTPLKIEAIKRYSCDANNVYILVGGLGGFALEFVDWLTLRGAKKLVLISRRGVTTSYQAFKIRKWKSSGVHVEISTHDVTKETGCREMLELANSIGPVEAIFNLAMVPKNLTFQHQTRDTFDVACAPKATATLVLDKLSRILCPNLRDFVVFSSYICGRGNAGQSNYGLANSVMERVCEKRKKDGLRALAIQWGAIGDVGYIAREKITQLKHVLYEQSLDSCLNCLDKFLNQDNAVVSSYLPSDMKIERKTENVTQMQLEAIAKTMGIKDLKTISHQMTLAELGMDSIVAVELKNMLERNYEIFLSTKEMRALTFARLEELFGSKSTSLNTDVCESNAKVSLILGLFMKLISDDLSAYKPLTYIPTRISDKNYDNDVLPCCESVAYIVPGPGGCVTRFLSLSQQLKIKACILQLGLDHIDEDVACMVDRLYKNLKKQLNPNAPFHLVGYSFGTTLVLELAARLEHEGLKGIVYCIDGSPLWSKIVITTEAPDSEDVKLQNDLIGCLVNYIASGKSLSILNDIKEMNSFHEKVDYALQNLNEDINYSKEYLQQSILTYYNQINALRNYNIDNTVKLQSRIVLIRTEDDVFVSLSDSYGLEKWAKDNIDVYLLKSDHISIIENEQCVNIINENLIIKNAV